MKSSNAGVLARIMNPIAPLKLKIAFMPQIKFNREACTGCGKCAAVCTEKNFIIDGTGKADMMKGTCHKCYECVTNCPSGALSTNWSMIENLSRLMNKLADGSKSKIYPEL